MMQSIFSKSVVVAYFFILLLVYVAVSKMRNFENLQVKLAQQFPSIPL